MEEELKFRKLQGGEQQLEDTAKQVMSEGGEQGIQQLLAVGRDVLAEIIDKQKGADITDQSIFRQHAQMYEKEFFQDMEDLCVRPPDIVTRVSEYIPEIISYIQSIVSQGFGYEVDGSVYFDTHAFRQQGHTYGKLEPWSVGNTALAAESEANFESTHKRSPADFALWKKSKAGEPFWESPWGVGRPGWHIECSAMASKILGMNIDIHSGGEDLRFPHHDNELAQAEAYYHCEGCKQWVNYFLHSGHLNIEGLKMSKTLKNFITIREALQEFNARQIRLLFLLKAWHKPIMFNNDAKEEMKSKEDLLKNFFQNLDVELRNQKASDETKWGIDEVTLNHKITECQIHVHQALLDNIDTGKAMMLICDLVAEVNRYTMTCAQQKRKSQGLLMQKAGSYIARILTIFGLIKSPFDSPTAAFSSISPATIVDKALPQVLDAFTGYRDEIRNMARSGCDTSQIQEACNKHQSNLDMLRQLCRGSGLGEQIYIAFADFLAAIQEVTQNEVKSRDILNLCDFVRDETLVELGIRLEDRQHGSVWKRDDPQTLKQEMQEKKRAQKDAQVNKLERQIDAKEKELAKLIELNSRPSVQYYFKDKYSNWNKDGYPVQDCDGNSLDDKVMKKVIKEIDKYNKALQPLQKKIEEGGINWQQQLQTEIVQLKQKLDQFSR
eukprot:TRINITY_DN23592_c0_g1_i5.p1 TRINITY_DN23592_c0_g1~~TRINITY_DN23592_c0_g1_i5.p1  ORF type:complete len:666 (-),score=62.96 TRINITY_DN23592_c0_g1_i5:249-2246(-)